MRAFFSLTAQVGVRLQSRIEAAAVNCPPDSGPFTFYSDTVTCGHWHRAASSRRRRLAPAWNTNL
jgi:hypothetical protein